VVQSAGELQSPIFDFFDRMDRIPRIKKHGKNFNIVILIVILKILLILSKKRLGHPPEVFAYSFVPFVV